MSFGYQDAQLLCRSIQFPGKLTLSLNRTGYLEVADAGTVMMSLTRTGNVEFAGTLTVTGAQTFTGAATFGAAGTALTVTNNALVSGTLTVTGAQTLTGVTTFTTSPIFTASAPPRQIVTRTDEDAQNATLTIAELAGGLIVHTSVTGGGTITTDTAANIIAAAGAWPGLTANGQTLVCYFVNDGTQLDTFAAGVGVTIVNANTVATLEGAVLLFVRTAATTVDLHIIN